MIKKAKGFIAYTSIRLRQFKKPAAKQYEGLP